jgi:acid phosphatase class B
VLLKESFFFDKPSDDVWSKREKRWDKWSKKREVNAYGICDLHEKKG